jgi:hypothetical protein
MKSLNVIVDHFFANPNNMSGGLSGNILYSIVNPYSSLLSLKASFKNPKASKHLPIEVNSIHHTYKHRIDVVSVSNKEIGRNVQLIPAQNLKSLKYGIFEV